MDNRDPLVTRELVQIIEGQWALAQSNASANAWSTIEYSRWMGWVEALNWTLLELQKRGAVLSEYIEIPL